ncbi:uncharacterized protein LOC144318534 isoform X3 [Canis aureus]
MRFDEDWNGLIRQGSHPHTFIFIIPVSTYSAGMSSVSTCVTYMTSQLWNQPFLQRLLVPFNGQWRMVFRHQDLDVRSALTNEHLPSVLMIENTTLNPNEGNIIL